MTSVRGLIVVFFFNRIVCFDKVGKIVCAILLESLDSGYVVKQGFRKDTAVLEARGIFYLFDAQTRKIYILLKSQKNIELECFYEGKESITFISKDDLVIYVYCKFKRRLNKQRNIKDYFEYSFTNNFIDSLHFKGISEFSKPYEYEFYVLWAMDKKSKAPFLFLIGADNFFIEVKVAENLGYCLDQIVHSKLVRFNKENGQAIILLFDNTGGLWSMKCSIWGSGESAEITDRVTAVMMQKTLITYIGIV